MFSKKWHGKKKYIHFAANECNILRLNTAMWLKFKFHLNLDMIWKRTFYKAWKAGVQIRSYLHPHQKELWDFRIEALSSWTFLLCISLSDDSSRIHATDQCATTFTLTNPPGLGLNGGMLLMTTLSDWFTFTKTLTLSNYLAL